MERLQKDNIEPPGMKDHQKWTFDLFSVAESACGPSDVNLSRLVNVNQLSF